MDFHFALLQQGLRGGKREGEKGHKIYLQPWVPNCLTTALMEGSEIAPH